jgi:hypothetical protein
MTDQPSPAPDKAGQWFGGVPMALCFGFGVVITALGDPGNELHKTGQWWAFALTAGFGATLLAGLGYSLGERFLAALPFRR